MAKQVPRVQDEGSVFDRRELRRPLYSPVGKSHRFCKQAREDLQSEGHCYRQSTAGILHRHQFQRRIPLVAWSDLGRGIRSNGKRLQLQPLHGHSLQKRI
eukprot:TRINITY_DN7618_c0_g1_i1.p2 TRINITY_DN7618_c0_g1~~TRINITY_DN7618_c0_g1_i1.p2  ORF type:complete len:100 (-),score=6.18 TRINITY_DN7618_c0_g1_i1:754-1053(-)